jgi:thiaminase/transcriptional activator TenA
MTLSDRILDDNAAVFDAMVNHRFVHEIRADKLPPEVFDRYLVYEGAFVRTAIVIFAHAVAKAPGIAEQRWIIGVLDALANRQVAYFEATFAARGIDPAAIDLSLPEVAAFREGMLSIAEDGDYLDILVAMFSAEWMYWTWCRHAAATPVSDPFLREWVDLHAADDFAAQALWLRRQIDAADPVLDDAARRRLSTIFGRVQELEIAFHEAAYQGCSTRAAVPSHDRGHGDARAPSNTSGHVR